MAVFRTVFILVIVLSPQFTRAHGMQGNLLVIATVAAGLYNVGLFILHMQRFSFPRPIIVTVDTILISLWVYFAGPGAERYVVMYFAVVIVAGLWFRRGGAFAVGLLCSILYVWAISFSPLPAGSARAPAGTVGLQVLFLLLTSGVVSIATEVQERERSELVLSRAVLQQHWERIRIAQHVDRMLRPRRLPTTEGLAVAFRFRPAAQAVSGDYYDVIPLGGRRWGIVIADIRAKEEMGLSYLPLFKSSLRLAAKQDDSPAAVLAHMNRDVWTDMEEMKELEAFICMYYVVVDLDTGEATCANAGMELPFYIPARQGGAKAQECHGIVLGVVPDATYEERSHAIHTGDTLVLFTDGMTEALDRKDRLLGREGLLDRVQANVEAPNAEALVQRIFESVLEYSEGSRHRDDMTLLVVKVTAADVGQGAEETGV